MNSVERIISEVIEPKAIEVDRYGVYPRASMDALGKVGLLGLVSSKDVGGRGEGLRAAAALVEQVGMACGSSGMVLCMHFCGAAIIEQ
ncbi:MAG TPA: acyl-CoA dehydrogenase family protein, partial [Archangium sp.]|nr:acyl-CoA dehydrogenase family protein [Archangium sp.]